MYKLLRLRHRYFLNRKNTLRVRYLVLCALLCISFVTSFTLSAVQSDYAKAAYDATVASLDIKPKVDTPEDILQSGVSDGIRKAAKAIKKDPAVVKPSLPLFETVSIGSGETVAGILQKKGISGLEAHHIVEALGKHFDMRKIQPGQGLDLHFTRDEDGQSRHFSRLSMPVNPIKHVIVEKESDESFTAALEEEKLVRRTYAKAFEIKSSVYGAAERAGIPPRVVGNMIRAYSWTLDFQRDIRAGDKIEVMYEAEETEDGSYSKSGDVLYASIKTGGRSIPIYRYESEDGFIDYYEPDGYTLKKMLMKTPVDGARISSGFGMRHHPVLGYNKMHKGMDFAAPTGTPVYAAGNGTIEHAGRKGAYGNYVRIRHNGKIKTAYAHLHRIGKGIKKGQRVKQGQVIGYVGSTGRSTGPHLHYEVLEYNKQVNPRSLKLPTGQQLAGSDLKNFKRLVRSLDQKYASLSKDVKLAGFLKAKDDNIQ